MGRRGRARDTQIIATDRVAKLLAGYQAPALDQGIKVGLDDYVARRKGEVPDEIG